MCKFFQGLHIVQRGFFILIFHTRNLFRYFILPDAVFTFICTI